MLARALRSFSTHRMYHFKLILFCLASVKFPASTVAGHFKSAVATNGDVDIVRFNNQKLNWTLKEFDVSS